MHWRMPRPRPRPSFIAAMFTTLVFILAISAPAGFAQAPTALPAVPDAIQVPAGNQLFLVRHAVGTQDYVCLPSGSEFKFVLVTPRATLFDDDEQKAGTHYFSPNPFEGGTTRVTWEDLADTDTVWGQAIQTSTDTDFVAPGAIGWLLLKVVGAESASGSHEAQAPTTYVQRLNTVGGVAPSTGCSSSTDVGNQAFVPYLADYYFYQSAV